MDLAAEIAATENTASPQEKKKDLFFRQKHTLDLFLSKGAISRAQYEKSLGDMANFMGFPEWDPRGKTSDASHTDEKKEY